MSDNEQITVYASHINDAIFGAATGSASLHSPEAVAAQATNEIMNMLSIRGVDVSFDLQTTWSVVRAEQNRSAELRNKLNGNA